MSLILLIIQTALQILQQQMGGKQGLVIGEALIDIISKAKAAYEQQTGQPIDVSLIKPYEPL
jgi:hypothetical protein